MYTTIHCTWPGIATVHWLVRIKFNLAQTPVPKCINKRRKVYDQIQTNNRHGTLVDSYFLLQQQTLEITLRTSPSNRGGTAPNVRGITTGTILGSFEFLGTTLTYQAEAISYPHNKTVITLVITATCDSVCDGETIYRLINCSYVYKTGLVRTCNNDGGVANLLKQRRVRRQYPGTCPGLWQIQPELTTRGIVLASTCCNSTVWNLPLKFRAFLLDIDRHVQSTLQGVAFD